MVRASLISQVQEALRGKAMDAAARQRAAAELCARIQRLRDRDARFAHVRLSADISAQYPAVSPA
jgi:hypothetical protein